MSIDEAITHCLAVADGQTAQGRCPECAEDHRQLAEWLTELKAYKEQGGDAISRQAVIEIVEREQNKGDALSEIEKLSLVNPQPKTGHWIEVAKYSDGKHKIECSECGNHIFDRGHANSYNVREKYKYCPRCGANMQEEEK